MWTGGQGILSECRIVNVSILWEDTENVNTWPVERLFEDVKGTSVNSAWEEAIEHVQQGLTRKLSEQWGAG